LKVREARGSATSILTFKVCWVLDIKDYNEWESVQRTLDDDRLLITPE
jgi:hypothetical protein